MPPYDDDKTGTNNEIKPTMIQRNYLKSPLAQYTELLNKHGPDAPETTAFIKKYEKDPETYTLLDTARQLRDALRYQNKF